MAKKYEYTVILEYDEEIDEYAALVPSLPGCTSQGKTREEALANVQEAIQGHIETLRQLGRDIPIENPGKGRCLEHKASELCPPTSPLWASQL